MEPSTQVIEAIRTEDLAAEPRYEQCAQCGAVLDHAQRYCVVCGAHRRHVRDPAARHWANVTSRSRPSGAQTARPRGRFSSLFAAITIAIVPLAVGLGVLIGHSSGSSSAGNLLAALHGAGAAGSETGGAANTAGGSTGGTLSSTFPWQSGYTVEVQTLPDTGTTRPQLTAAESSAKAKGAKNVGVIVQTQYKVTPAPPSGAYVIYAGTFRTRAQATAELGQLRHRFPKAVVIQVQSTSSSQTVPGAGKVLAKTQYGTAHQIAGYKPNSAQLAQGGAIVKKIQKTFGKSYVQSQRGLPDVISVP